MIQSGTEKRIQYLSLPNVLKVSSGMWALHISFYHSFVFTSEPPEIITQSLEMVKSFVAKLYLGCCCCSADPVWLVTFLPWHLQIPSVHDPTSVTCPTPLREPWHNAEKVT